MRQANEALRLAHVRIDVLAAAIARAELAGLPSSDARRTLRLLHESLELMEIYRDHSSANYQTALILSKL